MYALNHLKSLKTNENEKGHYFQQQLTGEESLYHTESFVNAQQHLINSLGEKEYLEYLKKLNTESNNVQK